MIAVARLIRTNDVLTIYKLQLEYLFHACNIGGSFILTYAMSLPDDGNDHDNDKNMKWVGICLQTIAQFLHLVKASNAVNVEYNQKDMLTIKMLPLQ